MIKKIALIILLGIIVNVNSQTNNMVNKTTLEDKLIGVWIDDYRYENSNYIYFKSKEFNQRKSGMEFKKEGIALIRANSGGCGTPPITYWNYESKWSVSNDSIMTINFKSWEGNIEQKIKVISVDSDTLKVYYLNRVNLDRRRDSLNRRGADFDLKTFFNSK